MKALPSIGSAGALAAIRRVPKAATVAGLIELIWVNPYIALALLVVIIQSLLLLHAALANFVTLDEAAHIASGMSHWQTGEYNAYRVNPPLPRMLAAIPVLLNYPDVECLQVEPTPDFRHEFQLGEAFAMHNKERYLGIVFLSRLTGIAWSLLGGWTVYRWAGELYGRGGAMLGLVLWSFEPNLLAHAQLDTPDFPAAVAGLLASYAFRRYLHSPSWKQACVAGLLLGLAELTKFTLLLFYALWPVLGLLYWLSSGRRPSGMRRFGFACAQGLVVFTVSILVINWGYQFQGSFQRLETYSFVSKALGGEARERSSGFTRPVGNRWRGHWVGKLPVPVPANYVRGIDLQSVDFESGQYQSYLRGEWRYPGWWFWYLYALAVKLPLPMAGMFLWSLVLTLSRHPSSGPITEEINLLCNALGILAGVSSQTGYTNHLRYVLPMFPLLMISTSKLAFFSWSGAWWRKAVLSLLVSWTVLTTVSSHPYYLSYFNEIAGGPDKGYEHLVDSNLDWGQDLIQLKKWLVAHPEGRPLQLAYYHIVDPRIIGIEFTLPPQASSSLSSLETQHRPVPDLQPGYYAVSVNYIMGHALVRPHDGKGGRVSVAPNAFSYFRYFTPIAKAGYSIFVYHLSAE